MTEKITHLAESGLLTRACMHVSESGSLTVLCVCVPHEERFSDFIIGRKWLPGPLWAF